MNTDLLTLIGILSYLASAGLLVHRLAKGFEARQTPKTGIVATATVGVISHAWILQTTLFTDAGLNLGLFNAIALVTLLMALLLVLSSVFSPTENLGIVLFPLAAISLLLMRLLPSDVILPGDNLALHSHVVISILSYSLLSVAAIQAILLSIQDKHLRNKHPGGFIRALPPLQTMEQLLFQMITLGFLLLTVALGSGYVFLEDLFAQHLVHKTVLSLFAWSVFAILLWGRWRFGWRGRLAIRWTLSGFVSLMLAYFGSKLMLEWIL